MEVILKNLENVDIGKLSLDDAIFGVDYRADILHRVVTWQRAKARLGCHKVKARAEVAFSTRKIYKQKGTGNARHGSRKAPIFVGGGTVFGPVVRSHAYSLNKKVRNLGLKIALSVKLREGTLTVVDNAAPSQVKTSAFVNQLKNFGSGSFLVVDSAINENLSKCINNIVNVNALPAIGVNVYDLLKHKHVLITQEGIKKLEERLK